jgi:hypothetical protein
MKIKRLRLNRLRNEEWYNFFTEFKTFVETKYPDVKDIEQLFTVLMTLYGNADETLEQIRKNNLTSSIEHLDEVRDNAFYGLSGTVNTALRHYDTNKRDAAERIVILLDHYGNIAEKPYNEETAAIYNFAQDIRSKYANEIDALDLNGWIDELERANNEFEKTVLERNQEYAGKTQLKMVDIRKKADRTYLDIVERIEALSLIRNDSALDDFIKTLNANIDRYVLSINRRAGKSKTKNGNNESTE